MSEIPPSIVLERAIEVATSIANAVPDGACQKSHRAAVIFKWSRRHDAEHVDVLTVAVNGPPYGFRCSRDEACRLHCGKVCVHAEEGALLYTAPNDTYGAEILHAKVVGGQIVASGPPSCWQCSRAILERGLAGVWLLHDSGWRRYVPDDFHEMTLNNHGLPTHRGEIMKRATGLRVEYYKDAVGKYRWTQYAENGVIRDASSEAFHDLAMAQENWTERLAEAEKIRESDAIYVREDSGDRVKISERKRS